MGDEHGPFDGDGTSPIYTVHSYIHTVAYLFRHPLRAKQEFEPIGDVAHTRPRREGHDRPRRTHHRHGRAEAWWVIILPMFGSAHEKADARIAAQITILSKIPPNNSKLTCKHRPLGLADDI